MITTPNWIDFTPLELALMASIKATIHYLLDHTSSMTVSTFIMFFRGSYFNDFALRHVTITCE